MVVEVRRTISFEFKKEAASYLEQICRFRCSPKQTFEASGKIESKVCVCVSGIILLSIIIIIMKTRAYKNETDR